MSFTLDEVKRAGIGSRFRDTDGDTWTKGVDGWTYDVVTHNKSSVYYGWSDEHIFEIYARPEGRDAYLFDVRPSADVIFSDVLTHLRSNGFTDVAALLEQKFNPKPVVKQNLVVTITIPVEDLDPMGDVWGDAVNIVAEKTDVNLSLMERYDVTLVAEVFPR